MAMSPKEVQENGWRLLPQWWPIGVAVLAFLFGAAGTYAVSQYRINELDRHDESQVSSINRIERNLVKIGARLGVDLESPP